ncbi:GntR family transcriptional regulator/MocR family aminotransferase [Kineococcus xinjiangensis]|uniref:GntR family transcriptional regulator/MocR family aminotransferase n=1 Tax=Kineococcus xinjiangensis TaxID=512762 RepID=A0A2S6IK91_9ACTN|nr:PLP-dependent aminotransferase family protein [Kineococcus xinjiangensis]PPK94596.1 GntR family transcriptional regulator/MocR family aminotransferase [Kineococcus xinjiangensis]
MDVAPTGPLAQRGTGASAAGGADFLQLDAGGVPARGLADWLTGAVRDAVLDGRLAAGAALPATRALARDLGVSRGVVTEAYQRLADEGLVAGRVGAGTRVTGTRTSGTRATGTRRAARAAAGGGKPVAEPVPARSPGAPPVDGAALDLWPGVPDLSAFPRAAWLRAEREVLGRATARDLGYGDPRGSSRLRVELAAWLARTRGVRTAAADVVVVNGVAQALALLGQVLPRHGHERIAVEDPGSRGARDQVAHWGLHPVGVPVDADGLDVEALRRKHLRAVLVTPAHQFPTGVVLAPHRRRELLTWAQQVDGIVVEDDYDAEHRYDRRPVPALQAAAPELVAHTGSTSKTLAPGLRLGWLVVPQRLHADVVAAKHATDICSPVLPQLVLAELLATGALERHLRLVRRRQRQRRDALLAGLREHLPGVRVHGVPAGLHLVATLPGPASAHTGDAAARELHLAAALAAEGVRVQPLSMHRLTPGPAGLVLGYAATPPDLLREAARRIAVAVGRSAAPDGGTPPGNPPPPMT